MKHAMLMRVPSLLRRRVFFLLFAFGLIQNGISASGLSDSERLLLRENFSLGVFATPRHTLKKHSSTEDCDRSGKVYLSYSPEVVFPGRMTDEDKRKIEKSIEKIDVRCCDFTLPIRAVSEVYYRASNDRYHTLSADDSASYFVVYSTAFHDLLFLKTDEEEWIFVCGEEKGRVLRTPNPSVPRGEPEVDPRLNDAKALIPLVYTAMGNDKADINNLIDQLYFFRYDVFPVSFYNAFYHYRFFAMTTSKGDFYLIHPPDRHWMLLHTTYNSKKKREAANH